MRHRDRYRSILTRDFRSAIIRLLETEYKIVGSHKVISLIADDIIKLHEEYYPESNKMGFGYISWSTFADDGTKPSYGKKAEDYKGVNVKLPLITREDIEANMHTTADGDGRKNAAKNRERDIAKMVRIIKAAKEQGGILSQAEVGLLLNRSLATICNYVKWYCEEYQETLPLRGYIMDQGSKPTHKRIILSKYESGSTPLQIARETGHSQEAVDRYIKDYERVKTLFKRGMTEMEICQIMGIKSTTAKQYLDLIRRYHPDMEKAGRSWRRATIHGSSSQTARNCCYPTDNRDIFNNKLGGHMS